MKCWKSAFNAQGSRIIIVALQVGAVKIYAATVKTTLKKKERPQKVTSPGPPPLNANVFNFNFIFECHPIYDQTQGSSVVFITL